MCCLSGKVCLKNWNWNYKKKTAWMTYRPSPSLQNGQVQASLRLRRPWGGGLISSSSIAVLSSRLSPPVCMACSTVVMQRRQNSQVWETVALSKCFKHAWGFFLYSSVRKPIWFLRENKYILFFKKTTEVLNTDDALTTDF